MATVMGKLKLALLGNMGLFLRIPSPGIPEGGSLIVGGFAYALEIKQFRPTIPKHAPTLEKIEN